MKHGEEGYIGELLLSNDTEVERTCVTISQVINKGIFELNKALELYNVPIEVYFKYLNNQALNNSRNFFTKR